MLVLATVFWGSGFTWAKVGGMAVQAAAALSPHSAFGPVFILAWRFTAAGIVWIIAFPSARKGWTLFGALRSAGVGALLALGVIVQHIGLDYTSEAVSAFLTSLTILFVPLLTTLVLRRPPPGVLWLSVAAAAVGVWLMTGAAPGGFGLGELLGVACAVAFSVYILVVNAASTRETPWRLTAGQFIAAGLICFAACAFMPGGATLLSPRMMPHLLFAPGVASNIALLTVFSTLGAFGILTHFQPRLDPTRAAMIYLIEPIAAAAFAWLFAGHVPSRMVLLGAGLILLANALVEVLSSRTSRAARGLIVLE